MPIPSTSPPPVVPIVAVVRGRPGRRCVVLMNQSSGDHTLLGVRPSPGPGRGAVSPQSSQDEQRKRSLPGSTVRKEGRAISNVGVLIFFAILGSVICARARVAGGAVVFG